MNQIIITAPSLDPTQNVSGVSSVVQFIIDNNKDAEYIHFQLGKPDKETGLINRFTRVFRSYKEWKKMLAEYPEALIHYSFPLSAPSILRDPLFMAYALRQKRKMMVHVHGGLYLTAKHTPFLLNKIMQWVFSRDVPFVVLSDGEKEILLKRFGTKRVEVLPNCPDLSDAKEFVRQPYDGTRELQLGYLGRIEPNKGMTELLEACKRLKAEGVNFVLDIAGKEQTLGEYLPLFQTELGKNFHYSGLVSGKTKADFLRGLDIFVMPTYFEGLPMSLLECMSYGVVPVVTPVGSIPKVIDDGENGILLKLKDVDIIVSSIKKLQNKDMLISLSQSARKTILDSFSPESYVEKLNDMYKMLIG